MGNVINPLDVIDQYGADTLRMYEMFMGPLADMKAWNTKSVAGLYRFLQRVWRLSHKDIQNKKATPSALLSMLHKTIKRVTHDTNDLKCNTAIAAMMEFINAWEKDSEGLGSEEVFVFLRLLAPYAPYTTEAIYTKHHSQSIHLQSWPAYNEAYTQDAHIEIPVQINGKVRGKVTVNANHAQSEEKVKDVVHADETLQKYLTHEPKKVIFVPAKIINFIL